MSRFLSMDLRDQSLFQHDKVSSRHGMPRMGRNNASSLHICHSQPTCSSDTPPSVFNHALALTHPVNLRTELTPCAFFFLKSLFGQRTQAAR